MCDTDPYCSIPPPMGLVNIAANHVEQEHGIQIGQDARILLRDRIAKEQDLKGYLAKRGQSHLDLVHQLEKQFIAGVPHSKTGPGIGGRRSPRVVDEAAVQAGIDHKSFSPLFQ
jgi:hypothetical protein